VDPLTGESEEVLWVKASGGDLGSAKRNNFASLYQSKVLALEQLYCKKNLHEDAIVPLYMHCVFDNNPAAPSIDTPLHAYVPFSAVSHMHSDAVIAIAASADVVKLTEDVFEGKMGYLPWVRPGFELGLMLRNLIRENPTINSAMMAAHGFICWADNWEKAYGLTIDLINQAANYIKRHEGKVHAFGNVVKDRVSDSDDVLIRLLPMLRGKCAFNGQRLIANVNRSEAVLSYLEREKMPMLAELGTSCPDHFLRTKIRPLIVPHDTDSAGLDRLLAKFRDQYAAYYNRCEKTIRRQCAIPIPASF
jgi:rhamnose utilization protein RhaD (predicted bifunctional aldolase and dehydrogenase)